MTQLNGPYQQPLLRVSHRNSHERSELLLVSPLLNQLDANFTHCKITNDCRDRLPGALILGMIYRELAFGKEKWREERRSDEHANRP